MKNQNTLLAVSVDWQNLFDNLLDWVFHVGTKILIALLILVISFRIINALGRRILKKQERKHLDKTITKTLVYLGKLVLKCVVIVCLIAYLGIDTSGFTALIASLGVGVGLAVNGALSNLAGGALILITRPFRIDDFIEAQGHTGTVEDIHITHTKLRTPDNKVVYIPNGTLSSGNIINYSEKDIRRVDLTFSIAYSADFEKAKRTVLDVCLAHGKVLRDPEPFVRISEHGASSVQIVTRVWTLSADYWTVYFDLLESVKRVFDEQKIEIPFPQLDVHLKQN